ncbi:ankyrin repeat-containing domain protein [Hypomontagnella monticulosa]|nr:ankyrin repeat-containing domain protein [Hypomontagnella monticulosa]
MPLGVALVYIETKPPLRLLESHCSVAKICLRLLMAENDDIDDWRHDFEDRRNRIEELSDDTDCSDDTDDRDDRAEIGYSHREDVNKHMGDGGDDKDHGDDYTRDEGGIVNESDDPDDRGGIYYESDGVDDGSDIYYESDGIDDEGDDGEDGNGVIEGGSDDTNDENSDMRHGNESPGEGSNNENRPQYPLEVYSRYHWVTHIQTQEGQKVDILLSKLLKKFLGSFSRSSNYYRRWHHQVATSRTPSTSIFYDPDSDPCGIEFNEISPGDTAVLAACRLSIHSLLTDWWTKSEITLSEQNMLGDSLLRLAATGGSKSICEILVKRGMFMNMDADAFALTLYAAAEKRDNTEAIEFLAQESAYWDVSSRSRAYGAALFQAAYKGNLDIVEFLVQELMGVAMASVDDNTYVKDVVPLAVESNHVDVVRLLVQKGKVDVNAFPASKHPLLEAIKHGCTEIVKFLVRDAKADMKLCAATRDFSEAFALATIRGKVETIRFLVKECGIDVNAHTARHFSSPLASAISSGNIKMVKFLIQECKADVNLPLENGDFGSALTAAVAHGNIETIKLLVKEGGADVNLCLESGSYGSALIAAAVRGNVEAVKFLVEEGGANIDFCPEYGRHGSALAAAAFYGRAECVEALLSLGAEVNLRLQLGRYNTALQR